MYQALGESLNLPAVWLLHQIGLDKGYEKQRNLAFRYQKRSVLWFSPWRITNGCFATNYGGSL